MTRYYFGKAAAVALIGRRVRSLMEFRRCYRRRRESCNARLYPRVPS